MRFLFVDAGIYRHHLPEPFRTTNHVRRLAATLITEEVTRTKLLTGKLAFSRGLLLIASAIRRAGGLVDFVHLETLNNVTLRERLDSATVICMYAMTPTIDKCLRVARIAKSENPNCFVAIGGPHTSATREELLANDEVDFVPRANCGIHETLKELLGTYHRARSSGPEVTINFDTPNGHSEYSDYIDYSVLPRQLCEYYLNVSTSHGCCYSCKFCSDGLRAARYRSIDDLMGELRFLDRMLPPHSWVHFFDSIFTIPRERAAIIAHRIASETSNLVFSCDIKAKHLNKELAGELRAARFRLISIGFETGNDTSLAIAQKGNKFEDCRETAKLIKDCIPDCAVKAYWLLGLPGSSPDSARRDIELIAELLQQRTVDIVGPKFLVPYPETPFFCEPERYGLKIRTQNWRLYDRFHVPPVCRPESFTQGQLTGALLKAEETIISRYCERLNCDSAQLLSNSTQAGGYNGELYWRLNP